MFRFAHPYMLYAIFLIIPMLLMRLKADREKRRQMAAFAGSRMGPLLFGKQSRIKGLMKFYLLVLAFVFMILGLADPQMGTRVENLKQTGIDAYILLDVSNSMNSSDIAPSRLENAKHEISGLISKLRGERLGLVLFAGEAFIQFPLTSDYSAANLFLSAVNTNSIPLQGTSIAQAIEQATESFKADDPHGKAIIIMTDGEDHEGSLDEALSRAKDKGIPIYCVGFGSPSGSPIPETDDSGNKIGYKKDKSGALILSRLDENTLKSISYNTGGKYFRATEEGAELDRIYDDFSRLNPREYGSTQVTDYEDRYYYFIWPALILLICEIFVTGVKSPLILKLERMLK